MNMLELSKKLGYSKGDPIMGTRNNYIRSIYRVIKIDYEGIHTLWESLSGMVYNPKGLYEQPTRLIPWSREDDKCIYYLKEGALDFRKATLEEVEKSRTIDSYALEVKAK